MYGQQRNQISFFQLFFEKVNRLFFSLWNKDSWGCGNRQWTRRSLLSACFIVLLFINARADYTVASGSNVNASTLTGQSGVLTINGTLTVSSNVTLSGFTTIIINAPNGQIYWSNNSDLTFSTGTKINIQTGAPGIQSNGTNSSQRLIIGNVIIAVSNDNSNAAIFDFSQINQLGGLPHYTTSYSSPACSGTAFTATISAPNVVAGVSFSYSWTVSPAVTLSYNSDHSSVTFTPNVGTYTFSCVATANTYQTTNTFTVNILPPYTWLGVTSSWSDLSDWCPGIPLSTSSVTIPAGVTTPTIASGTTATVNNLTIASGAALIVNGILQVKGTITNNGTLDLTNGTLEMNGTSAQSIDGSMFYNKTIKNLIVSNAAGLSVSSAANDTLKISGGLTFGKSNATLSTGDNIDFLSTANGTAYLGTVGASNTITGQVIVDRYINVGKGSGQHARAWEFLSFPTVGSTVKQSLMENGNNVSGYGVWLTDPGGIPKGFDASSAGPAIKTYNSTSNSWVGISNANNQINNATGYMIFIRGDRTVNGTTVTTPKPTILRSKGTLNISSQPTISVSPDQYQSIGNPYPASIDFTKFTRLNGVDDKFYAWDPYLSGAYGYGGYQTLSATNGWVPVPGGTVAYPGDVANSTIRSGQAFFVHATSTTSLVPQKPTISIDESSKTTSSSNFNFARVANRTTSPEREFLRTDLLMSADQSAPVADGNAIAFDPSFSNKIDGDDALKLANSGENFGIKSSGKILAVEARSPVTPNDTLYFNMTSMSKQSYLLQIVPVNMQSETLQPYLLDNYLNTSTALSLSDTNRVTFSLNTTPESSAANRFSIVFREMSALPVSITSVEAKPANTDVIVSWEIQNESGILQYEVQKSTDGILFTTSSVTSALNNGSANYQWTDTQLTTGTNYYRIKTLSKDGNISFSQVVKVHANKLLPILAVAPNPILNGTIHLIFKNEPAGNYTLSLSNQVGQLVLSTTLRHNSMSASENIRCETINKGIYNLSITKPDGNKEVMKVIFN